MSNPPLIAIVDDDEAVREALSDLLQVEGLDARTFASARAFLTGTVADFDCVITDVRMPGMDGLELQRRSDANHWGIASITAHPGVSATELITNQQGERSMAGFFRRRMGFLFQPVERGALPTLMAATDPSAKPGGYYGPQAMMEVRGEPSEARIPAQALDLAVARQLWDISERLSGSAFPKRSAAA